MLFRSDLVDALDFSTLQQPITDVATAVRTATDSLDQVQASVSLQLQDAFENISEALDDIDTTALMADANQAIMDFGTEITQEINNLFSPARDAITTAVTGLGSAINGFDPEQLKIGRAHV